MSLTGYLIEKYNNMGKAYTCRRLVEEAQIRDINLRIVGANDYQISPSASTKTAKSTKQSQDAEEPLLTTLPFLGPVDFVINRYKTGHVKDAINLLGKRSYNPLIPFSRFINKYEQMISLTSSHCPKPTWILGTSQTPFKTLQKKLGLPFVAKGLESSMGNEILLIKDITDYAGLTTFDSNPARGTNGGNKKEWLFEEFISTSRGRDIRLFCLRGQIIAAMERKSPTNDEFRANVALGAITRPLPISNDFQKIGKELYDQTGLDIIGIDLLYGKNQLYFCEINVMPGIKGIETTCKINLAGIIIDMIYEDMSHGDMSHGDRFPDSLTESRGLSHGDGFPDSPRLTGV